MSRVGRLLISIPEKVTLTTERTTVAVEGPRGKLEKDFKAPITVTVEEGKVRVCPANNSRFAKSMHGTVRSIIAGMVQGVTEGYAKELEIVGVGFRASVKGQVLSLSLGYSHPIHFEIPEGIKITVNENTKIKVEGIDKQLVGEIAARIKRYYPVEPYKGKGVRITGQYVRRKEGKKAG